LASSPTSKKKRLPPESAGEKRQTHLRQTVGFAGWWFCAQGLLYSFLSVDFALKVGLRFNVSQEPYVRMAALSLLCLGFFVLKALRDPKRQYLAVDILILYLLGHVYFILSYRLRYEEVTPFEWFSALVNFGLGASLALNRTRSTQMQGAGNLLSGNALDLARETGQWVIKKGPAPRPHLGDLEARDEESETEHKVGTHNKGSSEAIPHLD